MAIVFYNNKYEDESKPLLMADDRSFRYGDGLFESMVAFDGVVPLLPYHYERLQRSCEILLMATPPYFSFDRLKETVAALLIKMPASGYRPAGQKEAITSPHLIILIY
jgi:branched-subunit amino acid aminotransferase/4-amino-4-deoxychorismate lyase